MMLITHTLIGLLDQKEAREQATVDTHHFIERYCNGCSPDPLLLLAIAILYLVIGKTLLGLVSSLSPRVIQIANNILSMTC